MRRTCLPVYCNWRPAGAEKSHFMQHEPSRLRDPSPQLWHRVRTTWPRGRFVDATQNGLRRPVLPWSVVFEVV